MRMSSMAPAPVPAYAPPSPCEGCRQRERRRVFPHAKAGWGTAFLSPALLFMYRQRWESGGKCSALQQNSPARWEAVVARRHACPDVLMPPVAQAWVPPHDPYVEWEKGQWKSPNPGKPASSRHIGSGGWGVLGTGGSGAGLPAALVPSAKSIQGNVRQQNREAEGRRHGGDAGRRRYTQRLRCLVVGAGTR